MAQTAGKVFHKTKYWDKIFLLNFLCKSRVGGLVMLLKEQTKYQTKY